MVESGSGAAAFSDVDMERCLVQFGSVWFGDGPSLRGAGVCGFIGGVG